METPRACKSRACKTNERLAHRAARRGCDFSSGSDASDCSVVANRGERSPTRDAQLRWLEKTMVYGLRDVEKLPTALFPLFLFCWRCVLTY